MARSTTTSLLLLVALAGCGDNDLGACDKQADLTGAWVFTLEGGDLPSSTQVQAVLRQVRVPGLLSLGRLIYGTLDADDDDFFNGVLQIPELMKNDGSKTGSTLRCVLKINVPIVSPVTDDNEPQEPMRISLGGTVVARGRIMGDPEMSYLIMQSDPTGQIRKFTWSGAQ